MARAVQGLGSHWVLLDPDDFEKDKAVELAVAAQDAGASSILVGGSLLRSNHFDSFVAGIKKNTTIPVLLFPGDATQLSPHADGVLFLSLVSGRNPMNLIGEQVKGAPVVNQFGLEPLATAYMLVESGAVSSVEFMSNTRPLPRRKPAIAAAHALAAEYMGMSLVYLEAGSGAPQPVPADMVRAVRGSVSLPIIVGGGIRDAETAREHRRAGADVIVTGNLLRQKDGLSRLAEIAQAIGEERPK
jgi:phosphoglycerol geranylgeranyltransferase